MIRFYLLILFNLHLCLKFLKHLKHILKNQDQYDDKARYDYCREIIHIVNKKGKITVNAYGIENLPVTAGYVLYSNHQGKYDAIGIIETHEAPCRIVMRKDRSNGLLISQFLECMNTKKIDLSNPRSMIQCFKEIEEDIKKGKNYLIFPEGRHNKNKNTLLEFHTGCMRFLHNVKCPIIPVAIYDTYKVFNVNSLKKVSCEVHYLKPILYEEYEHLSKQDIAELVKSRIKEKLEERTKYYQSLKNEKKRKRK